MADRMVEKVAVALFESRHGHSDGVVPSQVEINPWLPKAHAALEACHFGELVEALEEITKGAGAFNMDPFEHAKNCIHDMKSIARDALAKVEATDA
jgi:hypothetical protein